jgi:hypothetical protein
MHRSLAILATAILTIGLTAAPALARDGDKTIGGGKDRQNRHETAKEFDALYDQMTDPATDPETANFLEQQYDAEVATAIEEGRLNKNYSPPGPTPCDCYK